ncbi:MAG: hypothetical protein M3347_06300, partial [Armatimonadota bacterium]|nr:hypothetical protein [Armatimonadota bacterium]
PNVERWDSLADDGQSLPPGDYSYKALYHKGIHANWIMSFANPGNPTWDTPDGRGAFYGDHTNPQAVAAGGNYVALACPMGEAGKHLIGCDLNGQRLWGLANRTAFDGGHISLATDGKILWVANEGKEATIYRVEIATGKYAPWKAAAKDAEGRDYQVLDLKVSDQPGIGTDRKLDVNLSAIALGKGVLAVCLTRENKIKLLDAETGAVQSEIAIAKPKSAVFDLDGSLIVLMQDGLQRVAPDGKDSPFTASQYPDGYALTMDDRRRLYLSVRGIEHNVKVLTFDGQQIREIGKRGGRSQHGPFDDNAMRNPAQIAIDSRGRLWVTEETGNPKRTSVWSTDGKFLKDFPGTTGYAASGAINPDEPTMGFAENTVWKIDLKTGAWRPVYSVGGSGAENDLFPPRVHNLTSRVVTRHGMTYVFTNDSARGSLEVHCTLFDGKRWRSAAHTGMVRREKGSDYDKYQHPFFAGHDGEVYAWADKNGDGLVQADELTFAVPQVEGKPVGFRSYYWGQLPDDEGTIIYLAAEHDKQGRGKTMQALLKFPISGFTPVGAPIYDIAHPVVVMPDQKVIGGGNGEGMVIGGSNGRVYLNQDPLIVIDQNGKVWGGYPNKHTSVHGSHSATAARPGYLIGPSSILGTANFGGDIGEVFYLNGNLGENYIFTHDGLWVQSLFKDIRGGFETPTQAVRGMPFDNMTAGGESFGGNFIRAKDGKTYVTLGGTDARVIEVTGLDSIKRFGGKLTYTPDQFVAAQQLAQEKAAKAAQPKIYTIAKATAPVTIDGKADEWPELLDESKQLLEIQENPQRRYARVQTRYDESNLYLAYRVFSPTALRNAGQDYRLLFKTGDIVDLMLGPPLTPPSHSQTNNAGRGGISPLRIIMTLMGGKPVAVLNQKVAPGADPQERYDFASPWRTIRFDRVVQLPDVKLATGRITGSYFVEAALPWKQLGMQPQSGLKLKG